MADSVVCGDSFSHILSEITGNIHETNCKKCSEYESQLCEVLDELGSARKIIEILQKELSSHSPTNECGNVPVRLKASSKPVNFTEWTLVPAMNYFHNQNKTNKHTNISRDQTIKTANRFSLLPNLEVDDMVLHGPYEQNELTPVQTTSGTKKHHNTGIKIPTVINGRLNYKENRNSTLATKKKSTRISGPYPNTKENKVRVLGDSHLKETAARIDQFLTSKFEVSSSIKPGAKMKELVGTMENDFTCSEKSDVILINGGANDVNSMRSQTISAVGNMAHFVQKYNNTNIVIVNIPHRYDLDRT